MPTQGTDQAGALGERLRGKADAARVFADRLVKKAEFPPQARQWAGNSSWLKLFERCARSHRAWRFCLGSHRRRSVEMQTRPSKKRSTIMRRRPACCPGPAVRRRGSPPPGPRIPAPCPGRVAPRPVQMKVTHTLIIDSSATALSHLFLSHSLCGWSRESRAASPGRRRLEGGA